MRSIEFKFALIAWLLISSMLGAASFRLFCDIKSTLLEIREQLRVFQNQSILPPMEEMVCVEVLNHTLCSS